MHARARQGDLKFALVGQRLARIVPMRVVCSNSRPVSPTPVTPTQVTGRNMYVFNLFLLPVLVLQVRLVDLDSRNNCNMAGFGRGVHGVSLDGLREEREQGCK